MSPGRAIFDRLPAEFIQLESMMDEFNVALGFYMKQRLDDPTSHKEPSPRSLRTPQTTTVPLPHVVPVLSHKMAPMSQHDRPPNNRGQHPSTAELGGNSPSPGRCQQDALSTGLDNG